MTKDQPTGGPVAEMSDDDLDRYILARLALAGVDISILPRDEPEAPADQMRILRSARTFLRETLPEIAALRLDADGMPPDLYPSALFPRIAESPNEPFPE